MSLRMFVGGLSFNTGEGALLDHFQAVGFIVDDVIIMRDRETHHSKGFGFVEVREQQGVTADKVIDQLHHSKLDGRMLTVNVALPKKTNTNTNASTPSRD